MKKWIAWLLLASMLFLAACGSTEETSSTSAVSSQTEQSSADSSETEQGELRHTLVSVGKPYTLSAQPESRYADLFGTQLTDGQKALYIKSVSHK